MNKNHNVTIDFLRLVAILAVILVHTTTKTLEVSKYKLAEFPSTFFLHELASFAVPLFFLISGFLLELNYRDNMNYKTYIKRRASKLVIPFVFWSAFYFLAFPQTQIPNKSFLYLLLTGQTSYQLYFIPAIIVFYIAFPFVHKYYSVFAKKPVFAGILLLTIAVAAKDYYFGAIKLETALRITILYPGIFLTGMIASHHEKKILTFVKRREMLLAGLLGLAAAVVVAEGRIMYELTGKLHSFYSQHRPSVFFYSLILGVFLFAFSGFSEKMSRAITYLSNLAYFVFFCHVAVLYGFWLTIGPNVYLTAGQNALTRIYFDIFFFGAITVVSFALATAVHKIPKLNLLTG